MSANPTIGFVILYYGGWPLYWPLWAASVRANPQFDFLLITDLPSPQHLPKNVNVIRMAYSEVLSRISSVIGVALQSVQCHKLCDFRPFFGLAFHDYLSPYSYWGYCDVDLFFGDLTPLMNMAGTKKFDFISPWTCTVGHCTLIRNIDRVNRIGLSIPNLKIRALEPESTFADEGGLSEAAVVAGGFTFGVVGDVTMEWKKQRCFLGATVQFNGTLAGWSGPFLLHYAKGLTIVYDKNLSSHEVMYFHFMGMKARRYWRNYSANINGGWEEFSFTPYGIVHGLLEPTVMRTADYRWRSRTRQLPGAMYRSLRNRLPDYLVDIVKQKRRAMVPVKL